MLSDSFTTNDFIDMNTYCYYPKDGQMRLRGVVLGLGWENRPLTPDKLSCYHKKGEEIMSKPTGRQKREAPPKKELLALFEKHEGKVAPIAEELKASWAYAKRWLIDAGIIDSLGNPTSEYNFEWYEPKKKQTPPPKPEQAANQEPDEGEGESASEIIPQPQMPIGCSLPREDGFTAADDKPIPYVPTPLEDSTEPQDKEMAKCDTVGEEEAEEYVTLDIEWPPTDKVEKALIEASINATFAVRRVLNDPVALALMKQVLESGVV